MQGNQFQLAPDIEVYDTDGEPVMLSDFWRERPTAFVFIRYLACIFCREQVRDLRDHIREIDAAGLSAVVITPAFPEENAVFARQHALPFPVLADPERHAYAAFGLREGTVGQLINPRIVARGLQATLSGNLPQRPHGGDPKQLPGTMIVDRDGRVLYHDIADDASDHVTGSRLVAIARELSLSANTVSSVAAGT
jgi:peroxiredoxin